MQQGCRGPSNRCIRTLPPRVATRPDTGPRARVSRTRSGALRVGCSSFWRDVVVIFSRRMRQANWGFLAGVVAVLAVQSMAEQPPRPGPDHPHYDSTEVLSVVPAVTEPSLGAATAGVARAASTPASGLPASRPPPELAGSPTPPSQEQSSQLQLPPPVIERRSPDAQPAELSPLADVHRQVRPVGAPTPVSQLPPPTISARSPDAQLAELSGLADEDWLAATILAGKRGSDAAPSPRYKPREEGPGTERWSPLPLPSSSYRTPASVGTAENGDRYNVDNDGDGRREPVYVRGYYRKNGTYVRGHYRARPR